MRGFAHRAAGRLTRLLDPATSSAGTPVATTVAEITPCTPRPDRREGARLNILLPSINAEHYFGGIHTAVLLYRSLCRHFPQSRIILVDAAPDAEALARFGDHVLVGCDDEVDAPRQIVAFNDRYGHTMPVGVGDLWLATAWWTAYAAQSLARWQQQELGDAGKVACLIQDFEPGFYAWSSQSAIALSTYRPMADIGVFNTGLLADYFELQGLTYSQKIVFEPTLNDGLRMPLATAIRVPQPRKKQLVFYARPSTPRNAFELICEALRCWGWSDPQSQEWDIVAPGELRADLDLGQLKVRALGKLDIAEYAELLSTSAVGLSLMISPHPSYPPLEMAAFGMGVLSNTFANKDLSTFSPNIRSIRDVSPQSIALGLTQECSEWVSRDMLPKNFLPATHSFLADDGLKGTADELASMLKRPVG